MTLQQTEDGPVGDDADDLRSFLHALDGCPTVQHTQLLRCPGPDAGTWFYAEADPSQGVARRRCVACGTSVAVLDSEQHWTHPPMHACLACGTSIVELAVGLHSVESPTGGARVRWLALAGRCVECGRIYGLTDAYVPDLAVGELAALV